MQLFDSFEHARGSENTGLINITRSEARIVRREDIDFTSGGRVTEITIHTSEGDMGEDGTLIDLTGYENELINATDQKDITVIDSALNTLKFGAAHDLTSGTPVNFGPFGSFTISNISGVIDGEVYYARVIDAFTIKLFDTEENALGSDDTGLINITRSEIKIIQRQQTGAGIDIKAGNFIFIGSESDVNIISIQAGQDDNPNEEIRLKTKGGIYSSPAGAGTNIKAVTSSLNQGARGLALTEPL
jgi:hypothetical protein